MQFNVFHNIFQKRVKEIHTTFCLLNSVIINVPYWIIYTTEYTEWQWPLSGVDSIMRVKLAQAGEGGGCTPFPFQYIYHHIPIPLSLTQYKL
jgi:hypothetical protein